MCTNLVTAGEHEEARFRKACSIAVRFSSNEEEVVEEGDRLAAAADADDALSPPEPERVALPSRLHPSSGSSRTLPRLRPLDAVEPCAYADVVNDDEWDAAEDGGALRSLSTTV